MTLAEVVLGRAGMPEDNVRRLAVGVGMVVLGLGYGVLSGNDFVGGTVILTGMVSGGIQALITAFNPPGPGSSYFRR